MHNGKYFSEPCLSLSIQNSQAFPDIHMTGYPFCCQIQFFPRQSPHWFALDILYMVFFSIKFQFYLLIGSTSPVIGQHLQLTPEDISPHWRTYLCCLTRGFHPVAHRTWLISFSQRFIPCCRTCVLQSDCHCRTHPFTHQDLHHGCLTVLS